MLFCGNIDIGDAVTSIISAVLIAIFIKKSIPSDKKAEHTGCCESADDGAAVRENTLALLLKRPFLLVFSLISIVVTFVYSQHVNMPLIILSTVIWTIGEILTTTNFDAYAADHSPESHRGRFSAVISFVSRSGFAAGPAVMGAFIKHNGVNMLWPVLFVLSMLSAALLYVLFISENSYNLHKKNTCINSK